MSKYIDLEEQIVDDSHAHRQSMFSNDARVILRWLDNNPDQVPGRTITESELHGALRDYNAALYTEIDTANRLGLLVVPDPEPTNAEKWDAIVDEWHKTVSPYPFSASFGEWMDQRGVKAPGGDDE